MAPRNGSRNPVTREELASMVDALRESTAAAKTLADVQIQAVEEAAETRMGIIEERAKESVTNTERRLQALELQVREMSDQLRTIANAWKFAVIAAGAVSAVITLAFTLWARLNVIFARGN